MEKFKFFWKSYSPFSQWFLCDFRVDNIIYNCAEQIMLEKSPKKQKKLGRKVKGFDPATWTAFCRTVVYTGNYAKFTQNPELCEKLLATKGYTLVEASPVDKIWGIGLAEDDPRALSRETWQGTNWLGQTLTDVRDFIITQGQYKK